MTSSEQIRPTNTNFNSRASLVNSSTDDTTQQFQFSREDTSISNHEILPKDYIIETTERIANQNIPIMLARSNNITKRNMQIESQDLTNKSTARNMQIKSQSLTPKTNSDIDMVDTHFYDTQETMEHGEHVVSELNCATHLKHDDLSNNTLEQTASDYITVFAQFPEVNSVEFEQANCFDNDTDEYHFAFTTEPLKALTTPENFPCVRMITTGTDKPKDDFDTGAHNASGRNHSELISVHINTHTHLNATNDSNDVIEKVTVESGPSKSVLTTDPMANDTEPSMLGLEIDTSSKTATTKAIRPITPKKQFKDDKEPIQENEMIQIHEIAVDHTQDVENKVRNSVKIMKNTKTHLWKRFKKFIKRKSTLLLRKRTNTVAPLLDNTIMNYENCSTRTSCNFDSMTTTTKYQNTKANYDLELEVGTSCRTPDVVLAKNGYQAKQSETHTVRLDSITVTTISHGNITGSIPNGETLGKNSDQPLTKESCTVDSARDPSLGITAPCVLTKNSDEPLIKTSDSTDHAMLLTSDFNSPQQELPPDHCAIFFLNSTNNLSIPGKLYGKELTFLVDTSAAVTGISDSLWSQLPSLTKHPPDPPQFNTVKSVSGQTLSVKGPVMLPLEIDNTFYPHQTNIIDGLIYDVILGKDFLQRYHSVISLKDNTLHLDVDAATLELHDLPQSCPDLLESYTAHALSSVTLPPRSETIITARLSRQIPSGTTGLLEPKRDIANRYGICGASELVCLSHTITIPIRLLNPITAPVHIYKHTNLGLFSPMVNPEIRVVFNDHSTYQKDHPKPTEGINVNLTNTELTADQKGWLKQLLDEYSDIFAKSSRDLGHTSIVQHTIDTRDHSPIRLRPYRKSDKQRDVINEHVQDMLDRGIIQELTSPWAFPVVMVKKKDGSDQFWVDYRKLNSITVLDSFPLPRVDDTIDILHGAQYFSTMDLMSSYWQVTLTDTAREKSAFITYGGLWEFHVMPFGLCNAPSTFQRLMESILKNLNYRTALCYLDDIIVFSKIFDDHLDHLREVFQRL